jgi:hypothetical protein
MRKHPCLQLVPPKNTLQQEDKADNGRGTEYYL